MIVRQFLQWVQTAPPGERADATSALARAYLYSDLSEDDRLAAEAAMTVMLDDPSPLVRLALAEALGASPYAPQNVVIALANDLPEIAEVVAARSPVLTDAELIELFAVGEEQVRVAIACREPLSAALSMLIAEGGSADACLRLIQNPHAELTPDAFSRIADRYGHVAPLRQALMLRNDLPAHTHQALVASVCSAIARYVAANDWMPTERAERLASEARERATMAIASGREAEEIDALVRHLVATEQLTGNLVLRALLSGNLDFVIAALAELSGVQRSRVAAILGDRTGHGFRALYERAGLPRKAYGAFQAALEVVHETGFVGDGYTAASARRRMVERVLTKYESVCDDDLDQVLAMLRRFVAEAAREEARLYTADLVTTDTLDLIEAA